VCVCVCDLLLAYTTRIHTHTQYSLSLTTPAAAAAARKHARSRSASPFIADAARSFTPVPPTSEVPPSTPSVLVGPGLQSTPSATATPGPPMMGAHSGQIVYFPPSQSAYAYNPPAATVHMSGLPPGPPQMHAPMHPAFSVAGFVPVHHSHHPHHHPALTPDPRLMPAPYGYRGYPYPPVELDAQLHYATHPLVSMPPGPSHLG
jgi:hypothetical protein